MGGFATGLRSYLGLGVGTRHIPAALSFPPPAWLTTLTSNPGTAPASGAGLDAAMLPLTSLPSSNFHVGPAKWLRAGLPLEVVSFPQAIEISMPTHRSL
jgi:hypothetical protein